MGQQQAALYLRLSGPGVRDVQRQQVFLSENRRHHGLHPRRREPPALPRVRRSNMGMGRRGPVRMTV